MTFQVTFYTNSGGTQTLTIQHYDNNVNLEFFADPFIAVGGKMRPRIRGQRSVFRLEYEACIQPSQYRTLFNNVVADLTGGNEEFTISEGGDLSSAVVVIPTEEFRYHARYTSQIGIFTPAMEFVAVTGGSTTENGYVESGYMDAGYVE